MKSMIESMSTSDWIQIVNATVQALVTIALGFVALKLTKQQIELGKEQAKLSLYDKRYALYAAVMDIVALVAREGRLVDINKAVEFKIRTSQSIFLVSADVTNYLLVVEKHAFDLWEVGRELEGTFEISGAQRAEIIERHSTIVSWIVDQRENAHLVFQDCLKSDDRWTTGTS
jgi:hypothetical protein